VELYGAFDPFSLDAMSITPLDRETGTESVVLVTATGTLDKVVFPVPRFPVTLSPQQKAAPARIAQAESAPIVIPVVFEVSVVTAVGVVLLVVFPIPNWPEPLSPQQKAAPFLIAQADLSFTATWFTPEAISVIAVG
jgi:L-asparagine transporter-like permease